MLQRKPRPGLSSRHNVPYACAKLHKGSSHCSVVFTSLGDCSSGKLHVAHVFAATDNPSFFFKRKKQIKRSLPNDRKPFLHEKIYIARSRSYRFEFRPDLVVIQHQRCHRFDPWVKSKVSSVNVPIKLQIVLLSRKRLVILFCEPTFTLRFPVRKSDISLYAPIKRIGSFSRAIS